MLICFSWLHFFHSCLNTVHYLCWHATSFLWSPVRFLDSSLFVSVNNTFWLDMDWRYSLFAFFVRAYSKTCVNMDRNSVVPQLMQASNRYLLTLLRWSPEFHLNGVYCSFILNLLSQPLWRQHPIKCLSIVIWLSILNFWFLCGLHLMHNELILLWHYRSLHWHHTSF